MFKCNLWQVVFFMLWHVCSNGFADELPANILDLKCWKLTLPYVQSGAKHALEVDQPDLNTFQKKGMFYVNDAGDGVVFRAHCTNETTKSSNYPRTELREMNCDEAGYQKARWSTNDQVLHKMVLTQAITALPPVKKHVVCAQIHDDEDDVMMVRLEHKKLFIERNDLEEMMLDENYELGTKFELEINVLKGHVNVFYNHELKLDWAIPAKKNCYFKAGCYTQSNPSKGDSPESYGEVVIYHLRVEHTAL